ncbi:hypothetical protein [Eggerthella guodeyinii]|uniref:Type VII secretion integral membrane protein EccD n=1 Tax=Eggerthella guodeyinii TaxID=2690837 RepID=A0A6N7RQ80_9ACTN|nr:hypothetical protein [Eggerthella guodeyinii]MRX82950.1 hypothetical protein [Eggerthella guodeyinii]
MRDEILVNVLLPATREAYDLWVPSALTVREASLLIARALASRAPVRPDVVRGNALMSEDTGSLIDPSRVIGDIGLPHRARLVLV